MCVPYHFQDTTARWVKKIGVSHFSFDTHGDCEMTAKRQLLEPKTKKTKTMPWGCASRHRRIVCVFFDLLFFCFFGVFLLSLFGVFGGCRRFFKRVRQESARAALNSSSYGPPSSSRQVDECKRLSEARRTTRDCFPLRRRRQRRRQESHNTTVINWHWAHHRPYSFDNTQKVSFFPLFLWLFHFDSLCKVLLGQTGAWKQMSDLYAFYLPGAVDGANKWSSASIVDLFFTFQVSSDWNAVRILIKKTDRNVFVGLSYQLLFLSRDNGWRRDVC